MLAIALPTVFATDVSPLGVAPFIIGIILYGQFYLLTDFFPLAAIWVFPVLFFLSGLIIYMRIVVNNRKVTSHENH
jgi:hypothetical protein